MDLGQGQFEMFPFSLLLSELVISHWSRIVTITFTVTIMITIITISLFYPLKSVSQLGKY